MNLRSKFRCRKIVKGAQLRVESMATVTLVFSRGALAACIPSNAHASSRRSSREAVLRASSARTWQQCARRRAEAAVKMSPPAAPCVRSSPSHRHRHVLPSFRTYSPILLCHLLLPRASVLQTKSMECLTTRSFASTDLFRCYSLVYGAGISASMHVHRAKRMVTSNMLIFLKS